MRKLSLIALAGAASVALAGAAVGAKPQTNDPRTHVMEVPLPDGSVARIEYAGDIQPKVTVGPQPFAIGDWGPLPSFTGFDRMMAEMHRQALELARQAGEMARQPLAAAPHIASYGNAPAGVTSTSVVSVSSAGGTCTRTTEVVSQGPGRPPKVTSTLSGNCAATGSDGAATPGKPLT